jgi:hypothetical protein
MSGSVARSSLLELTKREAGLDVRGFNSRKPVDALQREVYVMGLEFEAEAAATRAFCGDKCGPRTNEGIENKPCLIYTTPSPRD